MKIEVKHPVDGTCTVKDLVEILQQMPQDLLVSTEGCDCYGGVLAVEDDERYVTLLRD